MAVLTAEQLADLRQGFVRAWGDNVVDWEKATINAALQAIEDWFDANQASLNMAINAATAPYVFGATAKKSLVGYWLLHKAFREGAL